MNCNLLYAKKLTIKSEDELIMRGLLYDNYKAYDYAYKVYKKLFDSTAESVYLFREATSSLLARKHMKRTILRLKAWEKTHPNSIEVKRLLIPLYLTTKKIKSAKKEAEYLLERSSKLVDLDLASNSFVYAGDFKKALELLNKIYEKTSNEEVLLKITEIMDEYTGERKRAIQLLETHYRMNITSKDIYLKLLTLYQKEKDIDGLISIYKKLYTLEEDDKYLSKIVDTYLYSGNVSSAISFLEKNKYKGILLYELYKIKKDFKSALALIDGFYKKDKDPKWFAEKGVLTFENAEDKNETRMLEETISYFEKAIKLGNDDSLYLNYYGYTLINKEVDIKKGIKVIENALVQQPNNTYYLDSLAWGYYKVGKCKEARILMKRVIDEEGLKEEEIKIHWNAIKQCK
ncbi:MAG: hypothetical protein L3J43_04235 [Sulfurovum sp.]|nr:hypothetical protein [Sulfurovum sp.]